MTHSRRASGQFTVPALFGESSPVISNAISADSDEWIRAWKGVYARDLITDARVVSVDAVTSVEDACDLLLSEGILCLAVKSLGSDNGSSYLGLFDFSDVNAFLTLAATRHTFLPEDLNANPRVDRIVTAARAGRVPIHLVSNLAEKNPLEALPHDANLISLLEVFCRGGHRVLVQCAPPSSEFHGVVSARRLLDWFHQYAEENPSLSQLLSNSLRNLSLPSLNMRQAVVAAKSTDTVLDAMKLMSEEGVSSVAVVDDELGTLLSAVSVTDIGKVVVPSQSNQILSTPLHQFISLIKASDGSTDGEDKYPVYSVYPSSTLSYTIQKLLATNSHRLFVTKESYGTDSPTLSATHGPSGIVSVVDILSLFARLANVEDIDPTRMQRHRRASSVASSHSSRSERDLARSTSRSSTSSRTSSQTGIQHSPRVSLASGASGERSSITSTEVFQWIERSQAPK